MTESEFFEAIQGGDERSVEEALALHPDWAARPNPSGLTPLLVALYFRQSSIAELIRLELTSLSVFEAAAWGDEPACVNLLIDHPELADEVSPDGFTPLGLAAYFGHADVVKVLLDSGADIDAKSRNNLGVAALHSALAGGFMDVAALLVERGADVSAQTAEGWTPLHYCADIGDQEFASLLIARGADPGIAARDGRTPADLAFDVGHEHVALAWNGRRR